jgi:4-hydroxybenzoate polyprenyltransferase
MCHIRLQKIFAVFLFSSFYIASCAAAMAFQTAYLFGLPHSPFFYAFVFFGTVCSYNLHWTLTPKHFQNPIPPQSGLALVPVQVHIILALIAFVSAGILFFMMWSHWYWLFGAGLLSFIYTAPMIPLPAMRFLQRIAYGKTIFLTLAWTYITAMLPFLITDTAFTNSHILFCINRFFLIYAICILFDLRDRESDQQQGIRSMITEFAVPAVNFIYWGSLSVYFITVLLMTPYFETTVIIAFIIPALVLAFGYHWFKKQKSAFVYNFILDGLMVFSLPLLLLFRI